MHRSTHLQAKDHIPQEIVLPFVFASIFKNPERYEQRKGVKRFPAAVTQPWSGRRRATQTCQPPSLLPKAVLKIQQANKHFPNPLSSAAVRATPAPTV